MSGKPVFDLPKGENIKIRFLETNAFQVHEVRELFMPEGMSAISCTANEETGCPHCNSLGKSAVTSLIPFVERIQVRKHRKKRINKKWAKRYGYKAGGLKMVNLKGLRGRL